MEGFGVNAVEGVVAELPAVTQAAKALVFRADARVDERALRVAGGLGDDVDHAVEGIGAPEGAAGAADDFDAVDVVEQVILHIPKNAGVKRGVENAAIHEGLD